MVEIEWRDCFNDSISKWSSGNGEIVDSSWRKRYFERGIQIEIIIVIKLIILLK
jgi:hypothetical protein